MRIGYACVNTVIGCSSSRTFRLKNYSEEKLLITIKENLKCLEKILKWNVKHNILFFRVSSQLIPFASHPVCKFDWQGYFKKQFRNIGLIVKDNKIRLSMHPDQYVVINSDKKDVVKRSISELKYHCDVLDLMELDSANKIVIHVGGVYDDKEQAIKRFKRINSKLPGNLRKRLVVENDGKSYDVKDCLNLGLPVIVDTLHHELNNNGESLRKVIKLAEKTWEKRDGVPIVHYSEQRKGAVKGAHSRTISVSKLKSFLDKTSRGFDLMLEVKDKQQSVVKFLTKLPA
ncbi:UV DNA damage repair endonuclease UvsE [archaeon]|nr:UV DNA damage repair endonuclease UvsE [archaeon]